jgi:hypothetical protein
MNGLSFEKIVKNWLWVLYPVVVLVFLLFSTNYLFGANSRMQDFLKRQEKVDDEQGQISELKKKLIVLNSVDPEKAKLDLAELLKAVPASKKVWVLVSELKAAAVDSDASVSAYTGRGGQVKEASESAVVDTEVLGLDVEYNVGLFTDLVKVFENMEKMLPLIKIAKVNMDENMFKVSAIGAWANWVKVSGDANIPLPDYVSAVNKAKEKIAENSELPVATDSGEISSNPF